MSSYKAPALSHDICKQIDTLAARLAEILQDAPGQKRMLTRYIEQIALGCALVKAQYQRMKSFEPLIFTDEVFDEIKMIVSDPSKLELVALDQLLGKNSAIKTSEHTQNALYHIGIKLFNEKDFVGAKAVFCLLVLFVPADFLVWMSLGHTESKLRHYHAAIIAYEMALGCVQDDPMVHLYLAYCYEALGEKQKALDALDAAIVCTQDVQIVEKAKANIRRIQGHKLR